MIGPLHWREQSKLVELLDQTALPAREHWIEIRTAEEMAEAIRKLRVRGAPAIGIAAAYGVVLASMTSDLEGDDLKSHLAAAMEMLGETRPTAVNLFFALNRMRRVVQQWDGSDPDSVRSALLEEAHRIYQEDRDAGRRIGENGLSLLKDGMTILTHCHTGGVATSGYGTALAPLILSREHGIYLRALVGETRPLLQGSRITAWELMRAGIETTLITDSMAAHVMQRGLVDVVLVGADRIAANGDMANKIGTYGLAVLANAHEIPFYVSAPLSTIDMQTESGEFIVIEERDPKEVTRGFGVATAPENVQVYNPAFDVTPAHLISAIITERSVLRPPFGAALADLFTERELNHRRAVSTTSQ